VQATQFASITRLLPLPGRFIDRIIDWAIPRLSYSDEPSRVRLPGFEMEIRDPREHVQRYIFFRGQYEPRETAFVRALLRPGDKFVDAGANIGWFTLLAASIIGPSGRVLAFEPFPLSVDQLKRNVSINDLSNVDVFPIALDYEDGVCNLAAWPGNQGSASAFARTEGVSVPTKRLDDLLPSNERYRLLKIDVEGAEMRVFSGAQAALSDGRFEYILFEVNDRMLRRAGSSAAALLSLFRTHRYTLFRLLFGGVTTHLIDSTNLMENENLVAVRSELLKKEAPLQR
jgi:FkbM family methyltransferase